MKRIAIIMTVFNRKEKTLQCLKNIEEQTIHSNQEVKVDVYLTNDGCTDGTPEAVRKQFPYVNIIEGDGTLFWNRGMYAAWKDAAKGDYDFYLWLNDDTHLFGNAIENLYACSNSYKHKAIIIGTCCASHDNSIVTYGGYDIRNNKLITDTSKETTCKLFNGNIVFIPKCVFEVIGFNDPYYIHSFGDFDYSMMAYKNNIESIVAKGFFGICDRNTTTPTWCDPSKSIRERWKAFYKPGWNGANPSNLFYYKKKFYGAMPAIKTYISNYIHLLFPGFWK